MVTRPAIPRIRKPFARSVRMEARLAEEAPHDDVLDQADHHAEAGGGEAPVPVDPLPQRAADQGRHEGSEVDPHVEDREAGVAAGPAFGIELAHHRADIGLQQAGADDDQHEPEIERRHALDGHAEVTGRDDDSAPEHGAPLADELVGDPAARQREEIDEGRVEAVDGARLLGREAQPSRLGRSRHEEDEQSPHAVVAEALPEFGEEHRRESQRVTEELPPGGGSGDGRSGWGRGRMFGHQYPLNMRSAGTVRVSRFLSFCARETSTVPSGRRAARQVPGVGLIRGTPGASRPLSTR
jgi:hypothetical protein